MGISEINQIKIYLPMSNSLEQKLDDQTKKYIHHILDHEGLKDAMRKIMAEWAWQYEQISIQTIILYILSTKSGQGNASNKKIKSEFSQYRRERKRYLLDQIEEELGYKPCKKKNPLYLKKSWNMFCTLQNMETKFPEWQTEEEWIAIYYKRLKEWQADKSSMICSFPFFHELNDKRRAQYLIYDLGYFAYDTIINDYMGNSIDGCLKKLPLELMKYPVFSTSTSKRDFIYQVESDAIDAVEDYSYFDERECITKSVKTLTESLKMDCSNIRSQEEKDLLLEELRAQSQLPNTLKQLDSTDACLLSVIYSMMDVDVVSSGTLSVPLTKIVTQLYSEARKKFYMSCLNHLEKMARSRIEMTLTDHTGTVIGGGIMSFFDLKYFVSQKDGSRWEVQRTLIPQEMEKRFKECDMKNIHVLIQPSQTLKDSWKSNLNITILSNAYEKLTNNVTKTLAFLLQSQRTNHYPELKVCFYHDYLKDHLKIRSLRKKAYLQQMETTLNEMIAAGVIVKEYSITSYGIYVTFLPFTEEEKSYYNRLPDIHSNPYDESLR